MTEDENKGAGSPPQNSDSDTETAPQNTNSSGGENGLQDKEKVKKEEVKAVEENASLQLCNLVAQGKSVKEAKKILKIK